MKKNEKIEQTTGNIREIFLGIITAKRELDLSDKQIGAFCDNAPKGEDLWLDYIYKKESPEAQKNYSFTDYVREVLNRTGCPRVMIDLDLIIPD